MAKSHVLSGLVKWEAPVASSPGSIQESEQNLPYDVKRVTIWRQEGDTRFAPTQFFPLNISACPLTLWLRCLWGLHLILDIFPSPFPWECNEHSRGNLSFFIECVSVNVDLKPYLKKSSGVDLKVKLNNILFSSSCHRFLLKILYSYSHFSF